jgi:GMP synthase (glutamine-hydrolysing)
LFDDTLKGPEFETVSPGHSFKPAAGPNRRILVLLHQEQSTTGRIGRLLVEQGYRLDVRRPRFGDPLPRTMDAHDAAIIFGGPMSANDEEDWINAEIDWIAKPLAAGKPFLGICLGAQMLARHLGHRVAPHPLGRVEAGYYPIRPTEHGDALCSCVLPKKVYQWHGEGFDLPGGATLLAEGKDFAAQAFLYGRGAYGLQFHPEVTYAMMCKWTVKGHERLSMPGAMPRDAHLRGWFLHDAAVARWLRAFLNHWLAGSPSTRCLGRTPAPHLA